MTLNFEQKNVKWMDKTIPMKSKNIQRDEIFLTLDEMHPQAYFFCKQNVNLQEEWEDYNPIEESMFNDKFNPWEPDIEWDNIDLFLID